MVLTTALVYRLISRQRPSNREGCRDEGKQEHLESLVATNVNRFGMSRCAERWDFRALLYITGMVAHDARSLPRLPTSARVESTRITTRLIDWTCLREDENIAIQSRVKN